MTDLTDQPEVAADPLAALAARHLARMQEIADQGFADAKAIAAELVERTKKKAFLRDAILDKQLAALGITQNQTIPPSPPADSAPAA